MPGWRSTLKFPAFDVLTKCYSKCLTSLLSYVLSEYSTNIIGKSSRPRLSLFMSKFRISQHSMNMISTVTRTRLRRVKTLGQHHSKLCTTSTLNFHVMHFSQIPWNNARLKLSCKFGESKCNPYSDIILTTSHGTNHVLDEHINFRQYGPYAMPSEMISRYS